MSITQFRDLLLAISLTVATPKMATAFPSSSKAVLVITHATSEFDENHLVRKATEKAIAYFNTKGLLKISIFGYWDSPFTLANFWSYPEDKWKGVLLSKKLLPPSFFPAGIFEGQVQVFENFLGQIYEEKYRLSALPKPSFQSVTEKYVITGGNWLQCSCRSVQDIILRIANPNKEIIEFIFVREGIYEIGHLRYEKSASSFYQNEGYATLNEISNKADDVLFGDLVEHYYMTCLGSEISNNKAYKFRIERDDKLLKTTGQGKKTIILNFISIKDLGGKLNGLELLD